MWLHYRVQRGNVRHQLLADVWPLSERYPVRQRQWDMFTRMCARVERRLLHKRYENTESTFSVSGVCALLFLHGAFGVFGYTCPCLQRRGTYHNRERPFSYSGPLLWNSLPQTLRHSDSSSSLKVALKTHLVFVVLFCLFLV